MYRDIGTRWVTNKTVFWNAGVTLIQEDGYVQILGDLGNLGPVERHPRFNPDKMVLEGWEGVGEHSQGKHIEVAPIQVGDRVRIRPASLYYTDHEANPKDVTGVVRHINNDDDLNVEVAWDNGYSNDYPEKDLIVFFEGAVSQPLPSGSVRDHVKATIDKLMSADYAGHVMYDIISGRTDFQQMPIRGACHAQVNRNQTPSKLVIATRINKDKASSLCASEEDAVFYYDWLFNRSPLARAFITKNAQKAWDNGYVLTSCRIPANLMQAANVSVRQPWEGHNKNIKYFRKFVQEAGLSENTAWVLAEHVDQQTGNMTTTFRSHSMFSWYQLGSEDIARFVKGELNNLTERYCDNSVYSGAEWLAMAEGKHTSSGRQLKFNRLPSVEDVVTSRKEGQEDVYVNIFALAVDRDKVEAISLPDRTEWARILKDEIEQLISGEPA